MSLTRDEWIEMWASLMALEYEIIHFPMSSYPSRQQNQKFVLRQMNREIRKMKDQVQAVIGQMEQME